MPGGAPPAQQGKFKPRKPAKKIRAGSTSAAAAAAVAAAAAKPDVAASSSDSRGGRGSGGRAGRSVPGRGRGGRAGRGRGRMPLPQGKVFFTATPKPAGSAAAQKSAKGSSLAASGKKPKDESTEEVVGQLENAIGSSKGNDGEREHKSILDSMDYEDQGDGENNASSSMNVNVEGIMYDSDSSQEEERGRRRGDRHVMPPIQLPFPSDKLPVGIGEQATSQNMYECQDDNYDVMDATDSAAQTMSQTTSLQDPSPFVDLSNKPGLEFEQDTWFLVQMPTRLPVLKSNIPDVPLSEALAGDEDEADAAAAAAAATANVGIPMPAIAEVATGPVDTNSFDNSLPSIAPGRLGKIVVRKSGKTVLVLEGPGGTKIQMNVTEGLSCGFLQQAVAVDTKESKYIMLGDVKKSIVVTPDLDEAFPSR